MFACRIKQFAGGSAWINPGIATEGLGASVFGGYGTPIDRSVARCAPDNDIGEAPQTRVPEEGGALSVRHFPEYLPMLRLSVNAPGPLPAPP
jgi:hypothetical protein